MCSSCGFFNQYCTHQPSMFWENNATQYQNYSSSNYNNNNYDYNNNNNDSTDNYSSSSPNSVDCTLSLGTPSTRYITPENNNNDNIKPAPAPHRKSVSSFCWDLLSSGKQSSSAATKPQRHHSNAGSSTGDSLLTRRCANCDTTSTPLWRNGPRGPKSLCNACGIRYKKEERRAAAAAATVAAQNGGGGGMMMVEPQWAHQYPQGTPQKMQYMGGAPNEYRFMDDDHRSSGDSGVQFLSWLTYDRPSGLVHDFTR